MCTSVRTQHTCTHREKQFSSSPPSPALAQAAAQVSPLLSPRSSGATIFSLAVDHPCCLELIHAWWYRHAACRFRLRMQGRLQQDTWECWDAVSTSSGTPGPGCDVSPPSPVSVACIYPHTSRMGCLPFVRRPMLVTLVSLLFAPSTWEPRRSFYRKQAPVLGYFVNLVIFPIAIYIRTTSLISFDTSLNLNLVLQALLRLELH